MDKFLAGNFFSKQRINFLFKILKVKVVIADKVKIQTSTKA